MTRTDLVTLGHHARSIADSAHVAYWAPGDTGDFHERDLIDHFDRLAVWVDALKAKHRTPA